MKNSAIFCAGLVITLSFLASTTLYHGSAVRAAANAAQHPVVVELFTSEGCNTCPPADALLLKLETEQPIAGAEIIPIEEHVDYWNHDGWIDRFSSPEWTQRQTDYVDLTKKHEDYTPEMVVDGQSQFVGSNVREAVDDIRTAEQEPSTEVTVSPGDTSGTKEGDAEYKITVGKLTGATPGDEALVWLAVTEDGLHSSVTAGENAGHVLDHAAVLRTLHKIGVADANRGTLSFTGDEKVKFKSDWVRNKLHVVVFVQEKKSLKILGAATLPVG